MGVPTLKNTEPRDWLLARAGGGIVRCLRLGLPFRPATGLIGAGAFIHRFGSSLNEHLLCIPFGYPPHPARGWPFLQPGTDGSVRRG